jgi:hypothetical protein
LNATLKKAVYVAFKNKDIVAFYELCGISGVL